MLESERYAVGIDVGGTKIVAGLASLSGHIVQQQRIATNARLGGEHVLQTVR